MSPFEIVSGFRTELDAFVNNTIEVASHGKEDDWNAHLQKFGVTPTPPEERKELMSLKESAKGALPVEVRYVLEKHKASSLAKLGELKHQFGDQDWWKRVDGPVKKLIDEFIDNGIKKYIGEVDSSAVTFNSLYSNAASTTQKYYADVQKAGTRSEKCPTCMAARPAGTDLRVCAFCGSQIFTM